MRPLPQKRSSGRQRIRGTPKTVALAIVKLAALDAAANAVIITDRQGVIAWVNRAFTALTGYSPLEAIGQRTSLLQSGLHDARFYRGLWETVLRGVTWRGEMVNRRKDGRHYAQDFTITPVRGPRGDVEHFIGIGQDITERVKVEQALVASVRRHRALVAHSADAIVLIDRAGIVREIVETGVSLLGIDRGLVGTSMYAFAHPDDLARLAASHDALLARPGESVAIEFRFKHRTASWRWVEAVATNLLDEPSLTAIVVNCRDVTERKEAEALVQHQALHDPLTGLPNRALLLDRLEVALEQARRSEHRPAVLFVDLDGFKGVNDARGHAAGDQVLTEVAARLRRSVRASDTVARFGGDEFVLVLHDARSVDAAIDVARAIVAEIDAPISVAPDLQVRVGASVGIASYPEDGRDADALLTRADTSLYTAKRAGRNTVACTSHVIRSAPAPRGQRGGARGGAAGRGRRPSAPLRGQTRR